MNRFILTSLVVAAGCASSWTQASNVIFPTNYPYTQTNLQAMDVITSRNGKLEATVYMYTAGTNNNPIKYGLIDAYSGTGTNYVSDVGGVRFTNPGMYGFASWLQQSGGGSDHGAYLQVE